MKDVIRNQIDIWIQENYQSETICRYGDGWKSLSRAEEEVFAISIEEWPRLLAYWMAYEVVTDIYHHDLTRATRAKFKEYRLSQDWLKDSEGSFILFGRAFGLESRHIMAVHWKQTFSYVRSGDISFKDESIIQTVKKTFNKLLHFPSQKTRG